jgi:hypothetical protein
MNRLNTQERAQVVAALVEGASINSTVRMTGISKPTILKLLKDLGTVCKKYQDAPLSFSPRHISVSFFAPRYQIIEGGVKPDRCHCRLSKAIFRSDSRAY